MPGWRDKAQERVREKASGSTIKLDEGTNCVRVLPDKKDLLPDGRLGPKGIQHSPCREFRVHRDVGPDKVLCACGIDIDGNGSCWMEVKIAELEGTGVTAKKIKAQALQAQEQFMVQATKFDPDTQKFSMPKPWWVSTGSGIPGRQSTSLAVRVYQKIASSKKDYVDPVKGYNMIIERTGQGLKTRYPEVTGDEEPSKVPLSVLAAVKDLDTLVPVYDEEEMKAAYFGRPKRGEEEEENGRGKERLRSQPRGAARRPVVNEDEEESGETEELGEGTDTAESEEEFGADTEVTEEEDPDLEQNEEESEHEPADEEPPEEEVEPEEEEPPPPKPPIKKAPAPAPTKKTAPPVKKVAKAGKGK